MDDGSQVVQPFNGNLIGRPLLIVLPEGYEGDAVQAIVGALNQFGVTSAGVLRAKGLKLPGLGDAGKVLGIIDSDGNIGPVDPGGAPSIGGFGLLWYDSVMHTQTGLQVGGCLADDGHDAGSLHFRLVLPDAPDDPSDRVNQLVQIAASPSMNPTPGWSDGGSVHRLAFYTPPALVDPPVNSVAPTLRIGGFETDNVLDFVYTGQNNVGPFTITIAGDGDGGTTCETDQSSNLIIHLDAGGNVDASTVAALTPDRWTITVPDGCSGQGVVAPNDTPYTSSTGALGTPGTAGEIRIGTDGYFYWCVYTGDLTGARWMRIVGALAPNAQPAS